MENNYTVRPKSGFGRLRELEGYGHSTPGLSCSKAG